MVRNVEDPLGRRRRLVIGVARFAGYDELLASFQQLRLVHHCGRDCVDTRLHFDELPFGAGGSIGR